MQGAGASVLPPQQQGDVAVLQANGYAAPGTVAPAHDYSHAAAGWQAHDPAWQHYYQQEQQQQLAAVSHPDSSQPLSIQAPEHHPAGQPAQAQPQQPVAAGSAGQAPSLQDGAAWQPQLQRPPDWQQAQQSSDAFAQPYENGPTPPLPDDAAPPVPPGDQPPLPDAGQPPPPGQPQPQWPPPDATPTLDAAQQQQWPQQQWPTPQAQQQQQQQWSGDPQQLYWQQQGLQQPTWDASQTAYAQNGTYAAPNGAYQYPQYQQWPQQYQHTAYPHAYQQHSQYAAYGAWPAASAQYGAAQQPQQHQQQMPHSTPAAWHPAAAAAAQYAPAISSTAPEQSKAQQVMPPRVATAAELFWQPGRASRPSRIVVLLRGPPGSGKSAAARRIRQLEQDAGESVRVHSIDDYFVVEVEREVDDEKRAGRKRKITEMGYLYEAELEASYEASLLKAYTKTVDEGKFRCVLVDAPLLLASQLREYWRLGQKAGYEVFIGQPLELDPQVCHERNVHKRTLDDIQKAVAALEQPQPSFPQLDLSGVFGPPPSATAAQPAEQVTGQPPGPATQQQPALPASNHSIDEVDMEAGSDEERAPASRKRGAGATRGGSSSDDEDTEAALLGGASSRWGSLGDADEEVTPQKKKRKQDASVAAAEDDNKSLQTPVTTKRSGAPLLGILSTGGGGGGQRVRWADEGVDDAAGFSVGGASREQLETVFVLEGLGPPMDDEQRQALGERNFEDQVKGEHSSEHQLFRDHMLGGRR